MFISASSNLDGMWVFHCAWCDENKEFHFLGTATPHLSLHTRAPHPRGTTAASTTSIQHQPHTTIHATPLKPLQTIIILSCVSTLINLINGLRLSLMTTTTTTMTVTPPPRQQEETIYQSHPSACGVKNHPPPKSIQKNQPPTMTRCHNNFKQPLLNPSQRCMTPFTPTRTKKCAKL